MADSEPRLDPLLAAADPETPAIVRARGHLGAGICTWYQGDFETATAHYETSVELYRGLGDRRGVARPLTPRERLDARVRCFAEDAEGGLWVGTDQGLLRYDGSGGQFIFNWKTPNTAGKCYRVTMTAVDGSTLVAYFKLK